MRPWTLIGTGIGAFVLGLAAMAPATLIDHLMQRSTEGRLALALARGSIWSGSGQFEMRDPAARAGAAFPIRWRIVPAYLLRAQLRAEVELLSSGRRFPVTILPSRIDIAELEVGLPAAVLGLAVPRLAPLELRGELLLRAARVSIEGGEVRGGATLQWRFAGSSFSPVFPLGDFELRLEGEGAAVRASLRTLQGPLQLDGQGAWTVGGKPAFLGAAVVPPQHLEQLLPLMRVIALERGEGRFELRLN